MAGIYQHASGYLHALGDGSADQYANPTRRFTRTREFRAGRYLSRGG